MESLYITLFICYSCYAYNRKSVSFVLPQLIADGMDKSDAGLIVSCQNLAFALSKFSAGVLSDKLNPQLMFASGLFISGMAAVMFSSSSSLFFFSFLWFINGLAQGLGWPSCSKILRQTASPSQFGTLWSILSSSYNVSGAISPFLSAYIILNYGWRASVLVSGIVSVTLGAVLILSWLLTQNSTEHFAQHTKSIPTNKIEGIKRKATFRDLLSEPFLWYVSACYGMIICARTVTADWAQVYLIEEKHFSRYQASTLASFIEIGGFAGRIMAGFCTDLMIKRHMSHRGTERKKSKAALRMSVSVIFLLGSLIFTHVFIFNLHSASSTMWIASIGSVIGICYYGLIAIYGISASESAPSHLSGTAHAIASFFANVGATLSGLPFSFVAKFYDWKTVFLILEISTGCTIFLSLFCRNLTPKLVESEKED